MGLEDLQPPDYHRGLYSQSRSESLEITVHPVRALTFGLGNPTLEEKVQEHLLQTSA